MHKNRTAHERKPRFKLGIPAAVTLAQIINATKTAYGNTSDFGRWLSDRANRRKIPHRLETCGYIAVRNPYADGGLWKIAGARQAVYARAELPRPDQMKAAESLT